jgi:hypothetical protein
MARWFDVEKIAFHKMDSLSIKRFRTQMVFTCNCCACFFGATWNLWVSVKRHATKTAAVREQLLIENSKQRECKQQQSAIHYGTDNLKA